MEIRFPMWLRVVDRPGATVFAVLSATEAFSRSLIAGIIPLEAYALLETERNVSLAYTVIGVLALLASFAVPLVIRVVRRKWVFTTGCLFMVVAPTTMLLQSPLPFIGALQFRARSEEHTSELQSLMRISYAVFCLKKKITENINLQIT